MVYQRISPDLTEKRQKLDAEILAKIRTRDGLEEIYRYVLGLLDDTEERFQTKKAIWNDGELSKSPFEIERIYREQQEIKKREIEHRQYEEKKKEFDKKDRKLTFVCWIPLILYGLGYIPYGFYAAGPLSKFYWRPYSIVGEALLHAYPLWGTLGLIFFLPLTISIISRKKSQMAVKDYDMSPDSDYVKANKTVSIVSGTIAAGVGAGMAKEAKDYYKESMKLPK